MKQFIDALIEAFVAMFRISYNPLPSVGLHPFTVDECRTVDGEICTLHNLDRIVR